MWKVCIKLDHEHNYVNQSNIGKIALSILRYNISKIVLLYLERAD